ncbi:nascent polypeptide-associated complex subunit alpha, muscle-specific form-like isoform X1 [Hordeum vulgare subsp. vulgare]|uniref:glutathione transferase n=1 Tax=Hordeum vulgare subsp. vulgare TaxID=112509 RepID=F2E677_HORVV|nr:nascent polypeptide-associated complex subunit alpha, muscle-specific form-like isoform X1 [Hordeum vulgare subsp. vulgare]BAK02849.1 predicted protein [Hordeum vulgare subsp. vulgare]
MAGLGTGAGAPLVKVYHEKSMILPDVSRVLACLYEKNIEFETVKDSYKDILRLQSMRSVPVPFYDGPTFRQESRAICRYIAETYEQRGYPFLLGKDVLERASIEQWLRHEEHAFDPPSRALFCHLAFPFPDEDTSDIDREKRKLEEVLEVYEQRLGESEFLAGNKFTLADLVHLPNTHHIVTSDEFAYLYDSRKNVQRWWNAISGRDSWQQVVRDMQDVEEQYQMEELEQQQQLEQQWQWQPEGPEPPAAYGGRTIRIDPRKQAGMESRTILVPPPGSGTISSSSFTVQPLPAETTSHGPNSPGKMKESNFFPTTEKTPAKSKQRNPTTQKKPAASSVETTTSNFFTPAAPPSTTKMSQRTDADKPTSKDASSPTRPSQGSSKKAPDKLHLSDDEAATLSKPMLSQEARKPTDKTPYSQQPSEQAKKAAADQKDAAHLPKHVAFRDIQNETAPQARSRGAKDSTKEGREADQKRAATALTRELPPGSQNTPQAPSADPKPSDSAPMKEGANNEDDRFSTKRLRKMLEESDPAVLKPQSTDMQPPPVQADGARDPRTPVTADERRATSPPKGGVAGDDRGASPPRKSPSANERQSSPQMPSQSPPGESATPPAPLQAPASDAPGENEAVKPSIADPRGISTTPKRLASTPGTQRQTATATDQLSDQAPAASSFADRRNEKTGIDEARQTATVAPDVQPGGRAPNSSGSKPISSKDISKQTDETLYYRSSETSREMPSSAPEKSMRQQQLQSDKSITSPQGIGKQGSEAAPPVSGTEKPGRTQGQDLVESREQTSPDTQQVKNNRNNSKSDGSSKPTQFDGNKGDVPE